MRVHHITLSSAGRRVLTHDSNEMRALVRALVRTGRGRLILFAAVDDHVHLVVRAGRPRLLARDLLRALGAARPGLELQPAHVRPVESRTHLRRLVSYLLEQPRKHGLSAHPALWEGSCFQDLVGARLLPGFDPGALPKELPRLRLRELLASAGLTVEPLAPARDEELLRAGVARLLELAAGVFAVGLQLSGRRREVVDARALAVQVALRVGFRPRGILPFLGRGERALRRLAGRSLHPRAAAALALRLALQLRAGADPAR